MAELVKNQMSGLEMVGGRGWGDHEKGGPGQFLCDGIVLRLGSL